MRARSRPASVVAAVTVLLAVLTLALTRPAVAHTDLLRTSPGNGDTVDVPPSTVSATFGAPLLDVGSALVVRTAEGVVVSDPVPRVTGSSIEVDLLPDVPPGEYLASYRVVSADGHALTGTWGFAVAGSVPSAAPQSGDQASSPARVAPSASADVEAREIGLPVSDGDAGGPGGLGILIAVGLAGLVAAVVVLARRRR